MKNTTFILLNLIFSSLIQAQIPQAPTNLQSPNAASLGLYVEVPVSLFTGIPEISIPLFKAPDKYNGFSIGLSYHAEGVHPDQHPGWVGTNWTLKAGGCITRVVRGLADEANTEVLSNIFLGYYRNPNNLNDNDLTQNNYLYYDTEPDEFAFSFGNYSGKFYFDRNKNLVIKSNKLLKVKLLDGSFTVPDELKKGDPTSWAYTFKGFSIRTEDGTEYIFGGDQAKLEFNMEFWEQKKNQWTATAWNLAQIIYPNGKTIDFNYERGSLVNQMYISKSNGTYNLYEKITNGISSETLNCSGSYDSEAEARYPNDIYEGYLISPIYLTSIVSTDFRIEFQAENSYELRVSNSIYQKRLEKLIYRYFPNGCNSLCNFLPYFGTINSAPTPDLIQSGLCWKSLNAVNIYNNSQLIKNYTLNYDYSNISSGDPQYNANDRLFLMSVVQNDGEKYNFEYYNKQLLPPYLAEKTDHWGFYNNKLAQYNRDNYFSSREPDAEAMKYGILKKIIYPTGGNTEFEFEANQYSSQTKMNRWEGLDNYLNNRTTGGLRIRKITTTPGFGQTSTIKEYFYLKNYTPSQTNGLSSGILGGQIQYYFDNRTAYADRNIGFGTVGGRYSYSCFTTQSVLPVCTNSSGSHIGYSEVVEKLSDGSYIKYKFSNFDTGNLDEKSIASIQTENPYQPYNSKEQERGNLLLKEIYDSNNYIKLSLSNIYKKSDWEYINSIKGNSIFQKCPLELGGTYYTEATSYKIYTYSMLLDSTKTTYYDNSQQTTLIQTQLFSYNSNNQVINETLKTKDGKEVIKKSYYPIDIKNGKIPVVQIKDFSSLCNSLILNNCVSPLIAEEQFLSTQFIKGMYNDYALSANNYPLLSRVYFSNSDQTFRKVYECSRFDSKNNPIEITEKETTNSVLLWGYNSQYPIAEIKNATYAQVSSALGLNPETLAASSSPDMSIVDRLRTNSKLAGSLITTFTYKPLVGMTSKTDPRGITTHYLYDSFNRLVLVKDNNLNISDQYRYAYHNVPETNITSGNNSPVSASIVKNDNTYINTSTTATLNISGGSGNFGYNWCLKTSSGTVLQSSLNTCSTTFNFTSTLLGIFTLQCDVTDYLNNNTVTVTKQISCGYVPVAVTISTDKTSYTSNQTIHATGSITGTASASVTGGSGNVGYSWTLYNASHTVEQRGSLSTFDFICPTSGAYTIECGITDYPAGMSCTTTKNITAQ